MYYSYVEIEYVATSFSPARTDLALKLLRNQSKLCEQGSLKAACKTAQNWRKNLSQLPNQARRRKPNKHPAGATPATAKAKQGTVFAEGTQFNDKPSKPAKKTPGKTNASNLFTSVTRIKIKLLHGVPEVQTAIMTLLDYCLTTLQERDKHTRLLSRNKKEEAFKVKLPQDFTDFYDEWGL